MNNLKSLSAKPTQRFQRTILSKDNGIRLDLWLSQQPELHSRSEAQRWIAEGVVYLNDLRGQPDARLKPDDTVRWQALPTFPPALKGVDAPLQLVYQDQSLLVIDKPPQLVMHPSAGNWEDSVVHRLLGMKIPLSNPQPLNPDRRRNNSVLMRPGIVHRLDKDTSGLVVVAKQLSAHHALAKQFKLHQSQRQYTAVVVGHPSELSGTIKASIGRHPHQRLKQGVRADGKESITHWRVIKKIGPFSLCQLRLETGRTHQVRVHLAHMGWHVAADPLYGKSGTWPDSVLKALKDLGRQALHADMLGFQHPERNNWLSFHSRLPHDISNLLAVLDKEWGSISFLPEEN